VNLGLEETHVVGGRKHRGRKIIPQPSRWTQERVVEATRSHVTNVNRVQMFSARLACFPTVHRCRRDQWRCFLSYSSIEIPVEQGQHPFVKIGESIKRTARFCTESIYNLRFCVSFEISAFQTYFLKKGFFFFNNCYSVGILPILFVNRKCFHPSR